MNKILILGAGVYQAPLIKKAKDRGLEVHVVSPKGDYPGLKMAHQVLHEDTRNFEAISAYCKANSISGLTTAGTDVAIKAIGYAVDQYAYSGPSFSAAEKSTNKVTMKNALEHAGLPTAKFTIATREQDLSSIINNFSFPLMVKAVDTSGSRGISKVENNSELKAAYLAARAVSSDQRVIVEEFLEGTEIGAQVVVINGKVIDVIIHGDIVTPPPVSVPIGHYLPLHISNTLKEKITVISKDVVRALDIDNSICNFDIMVVNDSPFIIEVGARIGATCLPENISYHRGIDYYDLLIDMCLGNEIQYSVSDNSLSTVSHLLISEESGYLQSIEFPDVRYDGYSIDKVLDKHIGDEIRRFENGTDRYGHIIVSGPCLNKCHAIVSEILNGLKLKLKLDKA